jgi:RNA polymerase sigma factor (sigma-70 family)
VVDKPDESGLIASAQDGDEQALALLLRRYLPLVYNVVGRALPNDPDVDDVVQETMLQAVRALASFRTPGHFRSWLLALALRQVRRRERSRSRTEMLRVPLPKEHADPALDFVGRSILELDLSGDRREIGEATRWLPEADRQLSALWWQEVAGVINRAELAEVAGVGTEHAAVRIQRMRARLQDARVVQRALRGRDGCPVLTSMLSESPTGPDPRRLSRLSRHVRHCGRCQKTASNLVPPERLLPGMAFVPISAGLLERLLDLLGGATSMGPGGLSTMVTGQVSAPTMLKPSLFVGSAVTMVGLSLGFAVLLLPGDRSPAQPPQPVPARSVPGEGPPILTDRSFTSTPPSASAQRVAGVTSADLFVAPDGDDDGTGTIDRPFATLNRAVEAVRRGQTIALRGGRYRPDQRIVIGTNAGADGPVVVSNYRDEVPTLDARRIGGSQAFITHKAAHWTFQGLEITSAPGTALHCLSCHDNTFRRLSVHANGATAFTLKGAGAAANSILDSDFYDNHDDARAGADADGLVLAEGDGEDNVIRGCRFFNNADDGFDIEKFTGAVTVESSWAYGNGVNRWRIRHFAGAGHGFRLGSRGAGSAHVVRNNAAWDNTGDGFGEASNTGRMLVTGNTAYRNRGTGFWFRRSLSVLEDNLALDNRERAVLGEAFEGDGNSWDTRQAALRLVRSLDVSQVAGPRRTRATIRRSAFLVPAAGFGADMTLGRHIDASG